MRPVELPANQIRRFYRGGPRIAAFRRLPVGEGPEDWVASTATARGEDELGRSRLADGRLLADVLAEEPEAFFEPAHLAAYGSEPELLIKLLDAGQRLPVHFHPDRAFAEEHLGTRHGKTEAWVILEADPGASVHLGFARDVGGDLEEWVGAQDVGAMIDAMNGLPVTAGDTIFVPAGMPHVIGEGILLLELQEPSDLSLLLEWKGLVPEEDAFLGLPARTALAAATRSRVSREELVRLTSSRGETLFPADADRFFRADWIGGGAVLEPAFSVVIVTEGEGELGGLPVRRGSTVLVPFGAGACELTGPARAIRCRPPLP